jgi:hypothetical protein
MIPGALAALAAVLLAGRIDWQPRVVYFAALGALGWSFGGSMSYMQVVAYTHSGHSPSVFYGFACLFVIGFLWAALGAAGTALPAVVDRSFLEAIVTPVCAVFVSWWLQGVLVAPWFRRRGYDLDWYDTDWVAASMALAAVLLLAWVRRRFDAPSSLIVHMAAGWWAGFVFLVLVLHLRMTPPRGDNWAGCLGMTAGLLWYCHKAGLREIVSAALVCGFVGGIGFALASMLKLVEVTSGYETNWHSILEQTTGLFNGIGLAVAVAGLARWSTRVCEAPGRGSAAGSLSLGFITLGVTYLNLRKNVAHWVSVGSVPAVLGGIAAQAWFDLGYALLALALVVLAQSHRKRSLLCVPQSMLGKGQLLYLGLLWWLVTGNFVRELVAFTPQRLVTEGVIYVVALVCSVLLLTAPDSKGTPPNAPFLLAESRTRPRIITICIVGLVAALLSIALDWAIVRAIYGDRFAGHAGRHIRFGPNATVNSPAHS